MASITALTAETEMLLES